jgi:hypothetical protein
VGAQQQPWSGRSSRGPHSSKQITAPFFGAAA